MTTSIPDFLDHESALEAKILFLETENARLRERNHQLQAILDSVPALIGSWDRNLKNRFGNRAYLDWLGIDSKRMEGMHARDVIGEVRYRQNLPMIEAVLQGVPQRFEIPVVSPDGSAVRESLVEYIPDFANTEVQGFFVLVSDITMVKKAQAELFNSEQKLRGLYELSPIGIVLSDMSGRFIEFNQAFRQICGYSTEELKQLDYWQLSPEKYMGDKARQLELLACTGQYGPCEKEYIRKDGTLIPLQLTSVLITSSGGEKLIWSMVENISDRKAAERENARLNRALKMLSDCNLALAEAKDERSLIEQVCRLVVETGGYRLAWVGFARRDDSNTVEMQGQYGYDGDFPQSSDLSWDELRPSGSTAFAMAIRTKKTQINRQFITRSQYLPWRDIVNKYGLKSSISLPLIHDAQMLGVLSLYGTESENFSDEEIALLEKMACNVAFGIKILRTRDEREAAEAASRAKSSFLSNISHEIRTPLNAVLGMAAIMRREQVTPRQREQLDRIDIAAEHLLGIINDVLDLSKIESGKLVLEYTTLSLGHLLDKVASMLSPKVLAKGLSLAVELSDLPKTLYGDPVRITQALLNYANNAVKFTHSGTVTIKVVCVQETENEVLLRFEVIDTGIGIDPEKSGKLFSSFEQGDNSTTREFGGTGLGLAITKRLAGLMCGATGVISQPGKGSTFWFTAWLGKSGQLAACTPADSNAIQPVASSEYLLARDFAGRRILLVEDDAINRLVAVEFLRHTGLLIDFVDDGLQAIERVNSRQYDLILMDLQIPKLDGLNASRQIRAMPTMRAVPIIAMTANAFTESRSRCIEVGMNDFLAKPIESESLCAMILKWLGRCEALSATQQSAGK